MPSISRVVRSSVLRIGLAAAVGGWLAELSAAQINGDLKIDVELAALDDGQPLRTWGRLGPYPNGRSGFSMVTTACNAGTKNVPWNAAMSAQHPFIAFLFARESDGRIVQISNRSYVKHTFFALSNTYCGPCLNPSPGTFLGVGCSDTYATIENGDRFWLGPPDEINPWFGTWTPQCSFFDNGGSIGNPCDGVRSYVGVEPNAVNHRVEVFDDELLVPNANYYYHAQYVIRGELDILRENNMGSRGFVPIWNGSIWDLNTVAVPNNQMVGGTILNRWSGASVRSEANGRDDGRFYVAVKVTGPVGGLYHYEYAVHNRDNARGMKTLTLPISRTATVSNVGFRDIDRDPTNDWTFVRDDCELVWDTDDNPARWNTIFNFWFDSDTAPTSGHRARVEPFDDGLGQDRVLIHTRAPVLPAMLSYCEAKTNSSGCVPSIQASGEASASRPAPFEIVGRDVIPNTPGLLLYGTSGRRIRNFHEGQLCVRAPMVRLLPPVSSDEPGGPPCSGELRVDFNQRIQSGFDPALVIGSCVNVQWYYRDPEQTDEFGDGLTDAGEFVIRP